MKQLLFILILFISISAHSKELLIHTKNQVLFYQTDIATTKESQEKGLMFLNEIPENYGMTFLFNKPKIIYMWMKNTFIPLDMLFFDENNKIVHIHKNAEPFSEEIISSNVPALGVIEISGGNTDNQNIQIGDTITIK
jgi:uncharacterized membrane protein (UPF0127 family)